MILRLLLMLFFIFFFVMFVFVIVGVIHYIADPEGTIELVMDAKMNWKELKKVLFTKNIEYWSENNEQRS